MKELLLSRKCHVRWISKGTVFYALRNMMTNTNLAAMGKCLPVTKELLSARILITVCIIVRRYLFKRVVHTTPPPN